MCNLKILIIEENTLGVATSTLLANASVSIIANVNEISTAVKLLKSQAIDLVLFHVHAPLEKGFELFKYFDIISFKILFIINNDEQYISFFQLSTLNYLLKPITLKSLQQAIKKIKHKHIKQLLPKPEINFSNITTPKLRIPNTSGYEFIKLKEIIRCEADGRYTRFFFTNGKKQLIAKNIGAYDRLLSRFDFLRVHRSHVINLKLVKQYIHGKPTSVVMEDESNILVANSKRQILIKQLSALSIQY